MKNMSGMDRYLRMLAGIALLLLAVPAFFSPLVDWLLLLSAVVLIGTALPGFCPLYRVVGFSSRRPQDPEEEVRPI